MTKSDPHDTLKAFATLRVTGDSLVPSQVTQILKVVPTIAYRKGERYSAGPRSEKLIGRTGVWFFSTDDVIASKQLDDHLAFLFRILLPAPGDFSPMIGLHQLLHRKPLKARVSVFWHGRAGAKKPSVPAGAAEIFKLVPADVHTDFDTDEEPVKRRVA